MSAVRLSRRALLAGAAATLATPLARAETAARVAPVLYISHGAPIFAMNDPARIAELRAWGASIAKPAGIVAMTPHFGTRALCLGTVGPGFAMFDLPGPIAARVPRGLTYATPTNEPLARDLDALAAAHGARATDRPGFDHTTWMPLACLFPHADVPVIELSFPYVDDRALFALGQQLAPLRREGVVFVASGGMTHNLASMRFDAPPEPPPAWSTEFDAWATEKLARRDVDALVDWRAKAPAQAIAHPDDGGHFRVLVVALGVAAVDGGDVAFPITGYEATMSKRSVQIG